MTAYSSKIKKYLVCIEDLGYADPALESKPFSQRNGPRIGKVFTMAFGS